MKNKLIKVFWFLILCTFIGGISGFAVLTYFSMSLPKISTLADYRPSLPSQILARHGEVLATIGKEKREIADFEEIPKIIIDAFLSAEDDGFYEHQGVDYLGLLRAFIVNLKAGRVVQGGSTITQQVAKSLLLTKERSISRKIKDFLLAQKIEKKFSKKEILYLYLNQVYLGGGYYGVKSALKGYFGKAINEASIAEAAMIAGLLVAPGKYSPYISPKRAKTRQHYVLKRLKETGKITEEQYAQGMQEKIKYMVKVNGMFKADYFTEWVRQRVVKLLGEEEFLNGGFTVETTINLALQEKADELIYLGAKKIDKRQGFKGPLGKIDILNRVLIVQKDIEFRKAFLKKQSRYFYIDDDFEKRYDVEYDETEYANITNKLIEWPKFFEKINIQPGFFQDDSLLQYLELGKIYTARVTGIDDKHRVLFVSIAGVTGLIPYDDFKWAHKRNISGKRQFFPYVTKPSSILKIGDIVQVNIIKKSVNYNTLLKKMLTGEKIPPQFTKILNKERYLHCQLDQEPGVQAALVSMDPTTGEVLALVGGTDFVTSKYNRAVQSKRQPGSAFKPILFAAGLEKGFSPNSIIIDSPEALGGGEAQVNWKPKNYDGKFKGPITYRNSLEQSRNIPTIKIAHQVGVSYILKFAKRLGFQADMVSDLSLSLGSFGSTLIDLVSTYAIFPNGGKLVNAKTILKITDRDGNVITVNESAGQFEKVNPIMQESSETTIEEKPLVDIQMQDAEQDKSNSDSMFLKNLNEIQVYDKRLAYIMSNLLKGVVLHGTGRNARAVSPFIGGKTGTTSDYIDAWFLGFSSTVVTGVWTGFDNNTTMGWGETGTKSALPIWKSFMKSALKFYGEKDFKVPAGIINVLINKATGKIAKEDQVNAFMEAFVEGTEPGSAISDPLQEENLDSTDLVGDDEYYNNQ